MRLIAAKVAGTCLLLLFALGVIAQPDKKYDQHVAFDPLFLSHSASPFRSANGAPSINYWQNRADYSIYIFT